MRKLITPLFIDSATVRVPARLVRPHAGMNRLSLKVRYGFFEHPESGPCLIDTGYSPRVTAGRDRSWLLRAYAALLRPRLTPHGDALNFIRIKKFKPEDMRLIIVTHLHADHVAALKDFPNALLYMDRSEWLSYRARSRFANIRHGIFAELLPEDIETRLRFIQDCPEAPLPGGLGTGFDLFGDGSALTVALPGHTAAQFGILFPDEAGGLLYGVDAHWLLDEIRPERRLPLGARIANADLITSKASILKLAAFRAEGGRLALCHDPAPTPYDFVPEETP